MPRTLRGRLIASHVVVALLVLLLTIAIAAVPVRRAQQRNEERRLDVIAGSLAVEVDLATQVVDGPVSELLGERFVTRQARRTATRLLLVAADGLVLADSQRLGNLEGETLAQVPAIAQVLRADASSLDDAGVPTTVTRPLDGIDDRLAVIATSSAAGDTPVYTVVTSPRARLAILDRTLRPVVIALIIAAGVALAASLVIARTFSRPVAALTQVAEATSAGRLDARAPGAGDDEVGRLVRAFNAMIDRLTDTLHAQRALLASIAHELRTPLTSIQGYASALRDGVAATPEQRERALAIIGDESERMGALVEQVLQLARLESGALPLDRGPVALAPLLQSIADALAPQAATASVTLEVKDADLTVPADGELLRQAISILITNALRHTPDGGRVTLGAGARDNGGAWLSVTNSGAGIDPADLPHIFDRFYRGGDAAPASGASEQQRRFGLGLAIAREIVTRHGGTISVTSASGQGTTFTIELPDDGGMTNGHPA